jgi:hypothetical protein
MQCCPWGLIGGSTVLLELQREKRKRLLRYAAKRAHPDWWAGSYWSTNFLSSPPSFSSSHQCHGIHIRVSEQDPSILVQIYGSLCALNDRLENTRRSSQKLPNLLLLVDIVYDERYIFFPTCPINYMMCCLSQSMVAASIAPRPSASS